MFSTPLLSTSEFANHLLAFERHLATSCFANDNKRKNISSFLSCWLIAWIRWPTSRSLRSFHLEKKQRDSPFPLRWRKRIPLKKNCETTHHARRVDGCMQICSFECVGPAAALWYSNYLACGLQGSTVLTMLLFEHFGWGKKKTCRADVLLRDFSFCWLLNFDTDSTMQLRFKLWLRRFQTQALRCS